MSYEKAIIFYNEAQAEIEKGEKKNTVKLAEMVDKFLVSFNTVYDSYAQLNKIKTKNTEQKKRFNELKDQMATLDNFYTSLYGITPQQARSRASKRPPDWKYPAGGSRKRKNTRKRKNIRKRNTLKNMFFW